MTTFGSNTTSLWAASDLRFHINGKLNFMLALLGSGSCTRCSYDRSWSSPYIEYIQTVFKLILVHVGTAENNIDVWLSVMDSSNFLKLCYEELVDYSLCSSLLDVC